MAEQKGVAAALGSTCTHRDISGRECLSGPCGSVVGHVGERDTYSCRLPKVIWKLEVEERPFECTAMKKE